MWPYQLPYQSFAKNLDETGEDPFFGSVHISELLQQVYTDLSDDGPGNSAVTFRDHFRAHLQWRLDLAIESIGCQSCTAVFQLLVGL